MHAHWVVLTDILNNPGAYATGCSICVRSLGIFDFFIYITRVHSSRMRTVRCSSRRPGLSARGGYLPGVSARGLSDQGVSARRGCLPSGCLPRGCLPGGCLPGGVCPGGCLPSGCLPGGVCQGGVCPGRVSAPGGVCQTPPTPVNRMTDRQV